MPDWSRLIRYTLHTSSFWKASWHYTTNEFWTYSISKSLPKLMLMYAFLDDVRYRTLHSHYVFTDHHKLVLRDVKHRGRDIEGCMKQWFGFVKPNFHKYVGPQRNAADIIVPRGTENKVAISMISDRVRKTLAHKSAAHQLELQRLGVFAARQPPSPNVLLLPQTRQIRALRTLLQDPAASRDDFIFHADRLANLLVGHAAALQPFTPTQVVTPLGVPYAGLAPVGAVDAVVLARGGAVLEPALLAVVPDCRRGEILVQHSPRSGEPELHFLKLPARLADAAMVLLLDAQMASGGAALMAVRVLVDHGVAEDKIVFCCFEAGERGVGRLLSVFPEVRVVMGTPFAEREDGVRPADGEDRWIERKYLGC